MPHLSAEISALVACHEALVELDGCNWLDSDPSDNSYLAESKSKARAALDAVRGLSTVIGNAPEQSAGRFKEIGDRRINCDGSVSELVDAGGGEIGTLTTGIADPGPIIHDPFAAVPIPARVREARERNALG